jgi:hypothetical protein
VGYLDRAEVQQRVDDVLRATGMDLGSSVRRSIARAARSCAAGAERKACRTHLRRANKTCATGRAAATNVSVTLEKLTALKPPASLAAGHAKLVAALRAEQAGTPADPDVAAELRKAGYPACTSAA